MKKIYYTILFLLFVTLSYSQSWEATNLTQYNYLSISTLENHNNSLYALVFNGFGANPYQWGAEGNSWASTSFQGVSETPAFLKSAGSRLYMGANALGYSMLYVSNDDGVHFSPDDDGLPAFMNGIASLYGIQYFEGKVVANLGSNGYWIKDTTETTWKQIDTSTSLNGGTDPVCFSQGKLYAYDNAGAYALYRSDNFGTSWQQVTANLPDYFSAHLLVANPLTGRLYLAGGKTDGSQYGIYYSDDRGTTWTKADLSAFISTNVNGGQQKVTALFAKGENIFVALENNAANTTPDILSSMTGITNLKYDTLGLIVDPAGTIQGAHFVEFGDKIALALNVRDVYLKSLSTTTTFAKMSQLETTLAYPNPVRDRLLIRLNNLPENSIATICDLNGRQLLNRRISGSINVSMLRKGTYILSVRDERGKTIDQQKIIKQ